MVGKVIMEKKMNIGSPSSNLCGVPTVENVESLKFLIRIILVWSLGILVFVGMLQAFPTLEAEKMNRNITSWFEIPAASFSLFMLLSITIWIPFYDRVLVPFLVKFAHEPRGLNPKIRMGAGMILSIIAMVVSAIMETIRHDLASSNTPVDMSAM
ncbi:putative proton-dependent oligopeptide transporter family, MFS transporter superfamily [Helianthus annuus]|nr:putative proton-dependent oligopeptide transporter family, MFS transporter superfamily [Helianthus annuus]